MESSTAETGTARRTTTDGGNARTRLRRAALAALLLAATTAVRAQSIKVPDDVPDYGSRTEITTYNGSVTLKPGFSSKGPLRVYIKAGSPPNGNGSVPAAPSPGMNYVMSWTPSAPVTDPSAVTSRPAKDVGLSVQYFDGLGRPLQTVVRQGSLPSLGGTATDLVVPVEYDAFGRQEKNYLPYAASGADASYKAGAVGAQGAFYAGDASPVADKGGAFPYTLNVFENSPLDRVLKVMAPGQGWAGSGNGVSTDYLANDASDNVRIWNVPNPSTDGSLSQISSPGAYAAGQLYKTVTTDEAGKKVVEFKDKEGRVVLKKVQIGSDWAQTAYVYDDLGNLRCVVQPVGMAGGGANGSLSGDVLNEQCFRYEYDARNRMVTKKVPGAGAVRMVYDQRDRLVMTQDANMAAQGKWVVTVYDNLNRPVKTYRTAYGSGHAALQQEAMAATALPFAPGSQDDPLSVTHYDDYNDMPSGVGAAGVGSTWIGDWDNLLLSGGSWPYPVRPVPVTPQSAVSTKGLVTWTQTRVLDGTANVRMLASSSLYDDRGRVIQVQSANITGGLDVATTQYAWNGKPLLTVSKTEKADGTPETSVVAQKFTYDDLFRVVRTEQRLADTKVNNNGFSDWQVLSETQYDALGQLKNRTVGRKRGSDGKQTATAMEVQDYDYNIRGWLLGVNRDYVNEKQSMDATTPPGGEEFATAAGSLFDPYSRLWGFDLAYDRVSGVLLGGARGYANPQLTGNIAGMAWKTATHGRLRKYDFAYDDMNRIKNAAYGQYLAGDFARTAGDFSASVGDYDLNGNIKAMNQEGLRKDGANSVQARIDELTYQYDKNGLSNRLASVTDKGVNTAQDGLGDFQDGNKNGEDYTYDPNGNMVGDRNKKLAVSYNYLNLPEKVNVDGKGNVSYVYDAAGSKLRKVTVDQATGKTTSTLYLGGVQYVDDQLQFFGNGEGRTRILNNAYVLDFFLKDHLGNTRLVITDQQGLQSPVLEETHYYPFGLTMKGISSQQSSTALQNKKKYNGIEFNDDLDINTYEAFYRDLDPQIGRWWEQDPEIDNMEAWSPYASNFENPISHKDPLGNEPEDYDGDERPVNGGGVRGFFKQVAGGTLGVLSGTLDNALGTHTRLAIAQNIADPNIAKGWNRGLDVADVGSVFVGVGETGTGASVAASSSVATVATLGLSSEITVPTAVIGVAIAAHGVLMTANAASNLSTQSGRVNTTGSYTNTHESGKTYSGKGSQKRSQDSGKRIAKENNDPHVATDHTPAKNNRQAFKDEDTRIEKNGGHGNSDKNYNKRASPGKKYKTEDGQ